MYIYIHCSIGNLHSTIQYPVLLLFITFCLLIYIYLFILLLRFIYYSLLYSFSFQKGLVKFPHTSINDNMTQFLHCQATVYISCNYLQLSCGRSSSKALPWMCFYGLFLLTSIEVFFLFFFSLFAAHGSALAPALSGRAGVNGVWIRELCLR